jgi:lysophospholipase L1-like esterase
MSKLTVVKLFSLANAAVLLFLLGCSSERSSEPADGDSGADADETYKPPCLEKPSQVVILGDSYVIAYPDTLLEPRIEALARADGALGSDETYRNYAVPGTSMGNGQIPSQFNDTAMAADPDIETVIMDGGGNDVLLGPSQCKEPGSSQDQTCKDVVQKGIDVAIELYKNMAEAGVKDVVYFFYPHIIDGGLFSGTKPNEILDYSYPLIEANCDDAEARLAGKLKCHFIDLRTPFEGHTADYINAFDGVHPTAAGADVIAEEIWNTMKSNCIAQPTSKGCCTP